MNKKGFVLDDSDIENIQYVPGESKEKALTYSELKKPKKEKKPAKARTKKG